MAQRQPRARVILSQAPIIASRILSYGFRIAVQASVSLRDLTVAYNEVLLAQVQQTAACNALHAVEARLARWLLQTRDRTDSDTLPLTQEFLSEMLCVQRTTVNLVINQLEDAGVIVHRRDRIEIIDRKGLEDVACECDAISPANCRAPRNRRELKLSCPSGNDLTPRALPQMGSVGNQTVCVIEDEPLVRMDAVLLLEQAGFEVKEFAAVEKAIAFLETKAPAVVLVFTDIHTPGRLDGVALAQVASDRWP